MTYELLQKTFSAFHSKEEMYQYIMTLGATLPFFQDEWKIESNLVIGCQSVMHLKVTLDKGVLFFHAHSDALISKGLAAIMIQVYNGKSAEWVLTNKPHFLEELGILGALTPSRANGVFSLYEKMQKEALYTLSRI